MGGDGTACRRPTYLLYVIILHKQSFAFGDSSLLKEKSSANQSVVLGYQALSVGIREGNLIRIVNLTN